MICAQVAVNYGLFCAEKRFYGSFDYRDRKFPEGVSENTAREIYVNKFLRPNQFLRGPVTELPLVLRKGYLRAKLVFTVLIKCESTI